MGLRVAGYSLNGDGGATFGAGLAEKRIAAARDGDVVIAHINQPRRPAGGGVARGILDLKAKGYQFVKLDDGAAVGSDGTTDDVEETGIPVFSCFCQLSSSVSSTTRSG